MKRAALLALALAACAHETPQNPGFSLASSEWRRMDDLDANPHGATIMFESERASGSTGCNRWFGAVLVSETRLTFDSIGTTRMACADVQMATERNFLDVLRRAARYRLEYQHTLVVLDDDGAEIARFTRER
ncbi:MAG: META domain-containing protein [Hyphomonadaceae bacterium]|nr:META domain-containing protein [Hyphomonadaceae bacterium]